MAKLSVSIPDELVDELRSAAKENVSAFVSSAVRHELDRRRLFAFLDELEGELGPADEDEVAVFTERFMEAAAATTSQTAPKGHGGGRAATRSVS